MDQRLCRLCGQPDFLDGVDDPDRNLALGAAVMGVLALLTYRRLRRIERASLPLENTDACRIFRQCCRELGINKTLPVFTTPYLKSPVMTGLFRPRVLLPLHAALCSDGHTLRCILLHELNHYVRKDAAANLLMNLAGIVYWFNPLVWHALRQMRNDRETACDSGVLALLDRNERTDTDISLSTLQKNSPCSRLPPASVVP